MNWYVTEPVELERQRLDLSLGLRNSMWFFNNLACPGVGSVSHPRLYTHSIIGIEVARRVNHDSPILVANAIEALSLKATYRSLSKEDFIYRGVRAFGRDDKNLSYNFLKQSKNYVSITYRQSTSRYLTDTFGIGLVKKGTRFSNYELSQPALTILEGLNNNKKHNIDRLEAWVRNGNNDLSAYKWLSLENLESIERETISKLHEQDLSEISFFKNFKFLRKNVFKVIKENGSILENLKEEEKTAFKASEMFLHIKDLLDIAVRKAGQALSLDEYSTIEPNSLSKDEMKKIQSLIKDLNQLKENLPLANHQKSYIEDSKNFFASLLEIKDEKKFLLKLLERAPDFFVVNSDGTFHKAVTFNGDNFRGEIIPTSVILPYSVKNLSKQWEVLNA